MTFAQVEMCVKRGTERAWAGVGAYVHASTVADISTVAYRETFGVSATHIHYIHNKSIKTRISIILVSIETLLQKNIIQYDIYICMYYSIQGS